MKALVTPGTDFLVAKMKRLLCQDKKAYITFSQNQAYYKKKKMSVFVNETPYQKKVKKVNFPNKFKL